MPVRVARGPPSGRGQIPAGRSCAIAALGNARCDQPIHNSGRGDWPSPLLPPFCPPGRRLSASGRSLRRRVRPGVLHQTAPVVSRSDRPVFPPTIRLDPGPGAGAGMSSHDLHPLPLVEQRRMRDSNPRGACPNPIRSGARLQSRYSGRVLGTGVGLFGLTPGDPAVRELSKC